MKSYVFVIKIILMLMLIVSNKKSSENRLESI